MAVEWTDSAIILGTRPLGETSVVAIVFARDHGLARGLVRGGAGRRLTPVLQAGNMVHAVWRARLEDQLGSLSVEPAGAHAALAMAVPRRLARLNALVATARACLPERIACPGTWEGMTVLLDMLAEDALWPALYVRWEVGLLAELGFGLDLAKCAMTGVTEDLAWVSPRTGRAVCREAGAPWADRLLRLPPFLLGSQAGGAADADIRDGLALTGHFLERHILTPHGKALPEGRGAV